MQLDSFDGPTHPFTPIPLDALHWNVGDTQAFELDAELIPALSFFERNPDALQCVRYALLDDAAFIVGVLRHAPVLQALPPIVIDALIRRSDLRFVARMACFTQAERREIAHALAALEISYSGDRRQRLVTQALDSFWRSLLI